ncbi:hypothetical protein DCAR_0417788 [Daucus carota subsp. sativus]|uniref:Peroxidase n=1 Tax=Daucus carota subsp. sativus TaxID=79200 RepID=A0AAF1AZU8_DAUCS|nr:hypothetical protein DCAR_0417788 [Daucus carota subsp. sativus]
MSTWQSGKFSVAIVSVICLLIICSANAQLSANYYASSCPRLQRIVRSALTPEVRKDRRLGASLLRMHFHDCFVNGCDGSVLLDDTDTLTGEKNAFPNRNSLRGFDVIDTIKTRVEAACKDTVSCADILALVARDGTVLLGGPSWTVPLGRRDATTASQMQANIDLPSPASDLSALISSFANKGQAQCSSFRPHIYNDTNIDSSFAATRQSNCPATAPSGDTNLAPLDLQSPNQFGSNYYQNLVAKRGLLHSDQELYNGGSQDALVKKYSNNNRAFRNDFAAAMIKMGNISPLTGTDGEIRKNCRVPN